MNPTVPSYGDGRPSSAQTPPLQAQPAADLDRPGSTAGPADRDAEHLRDEAGALWHDARQAAQARLDAQKQHAAAGMGDVAAALRDAAQRRRQDGDESFARLTSSAADGLERLSGTLRSKDLGAMLQDVNGFARSQPAAFFGLALLAGFAAARFMKASQAPDPHAGDAGRRSSRHPAYNEPSASEDWQ